VIRVLHGDCRTLLPTLADVSVQCVVTSPPYYGLRDYGIAEQIGLEPQVTDYVEALVEVFREVRRVLRDDGVLWLNLGDSYCNYRVGDKGGMPAQSVHNGKHNGKPPKVNIGNRGERVIGCPRRSVRQPGLKEKDLIGIPWRVAFALQADGWWLRQDNIWSKPNPMPESVEDRTTRTHEYVFMLTKAANYFYDAEAIKEAAVSETPAGNGYKRDARLTHKDKDGPRGNDARWSDVGGNRNRRSVWTIQTRPYPGAHFATMPEELATICILAGSRRGDTVLDPFGGVGTTGAVAARLGRDATLIDLNLAYCRAAERRCAGETPPLPFPEMAA
jgi:DNA modification methylase